MDQPLFRDRSDAANQLLAKIPALDPKTTLVLGIPRGGVPMAAQISKARQVPMDILLVRKLSSPQNPEYAIGAVSLESQWVEEKQDVPAIELEQWIEDARTVLRTRDRLYRSDRPFPDLQGKTVLLVDDGIATGRTLVHAIQLIRAKKPKAIWVIVPVSSREAANRIAPVVDRFICLHQPSPFLGVGRFYRSFPSVTDNEVIHCVNDSDKYIRPLA